MVDAAQELRDMLPCGGGVNYHGLDSHRRVYLDQARVFTC